MYDVIFIVITHWVADFLFQKEEWALGKSSSAFLLLKHVITYIFIWVLAILAYRPDVVWSNLTYGVSVFVFCVLNFGAHIITDHFTSMWTKRLFEQKKYYTSLPNMGAFSIIGLDQLLHYVALFLSWDFIFGI